MDYALCLAWNWEHDAGFVSLLAEACQRHGEGLLDVTAATLPEVMTGLDRGELSFRTILDRAGDADPAFLSLQDWARAHGARRINACEIARRAWNKASMHLEFLTAGIPVPYTIILPPYSEQRDIPPADLGVLGSSFGIKPACQGGGDGVVLGATTWSAVLEARQQYPNDGYLLQASVTATQLGTRQAWFRVLHCAGRSYPCWWDEHTHVYTQVAAQEGIEWCLGSLRHTVSRIAQVCCLELFSTEIALTADGALVVVDYVNDPVDLRLQSRAADGVPDEIIRDVAESLALLAKSPTGSAIALPPPTW